MKQFRVTLARNTPFGDVMHLAGNFDAETSEAAGEKAPQAFLTALADTVKEADRLGVSKKYADDRLAYETCFLRIVKVEEI